MNRSIRGPQNQEQLPIGRRNLPVATTMPEDSHYETSRSMTGLSPGPGMPNRRPNPAPLPSFLPPDQHDWADGSSAHPGYGSRTLPSSSQDIDALSLQQQHQADRYALTIAGHTHANPNAAPPSQAQDEDETPRPASPASSTSSSAPREHTPMSGRYGQSISINHSHLDRFEVYHQPVTYETFNQQVIHNYHPGSYSREDIPAPLPNPPAEQQAGRRRARGQPRDSQRERDPRRGRGGA